MAIGIANEMKEIFKDRLELSIDTIHSEKAKKYNFKTSTNMILNGERLHIKTALDKNKLKELIEEKINK